MNPVALLHDRLRIRDVLLLAGAAILAVLLIGRVLRGGRRR
jgi:hypothetical protein